MKLLETLRCFVPFKNVKWLAAAKRKDFKHKLPPAIPVNAVSIVTVIRVPSRDTILNESPTSQNVAQKCAHRT